MVKPANPLKSSTLLGFTKLICVVKQGFKSVKLKVELHLGVSFGG